MSDISNSSSDSGYNRWLNQIDDEIECLTQEVNILKDFVNKTELECSIMAVKIKRDKVKALEAFARSKVLLAGMEIMAAESELITDVQKLRNFKKLKLESEQGQTQTDVQETNSKSAQTTKSKIDKKKQKESTSRKSPVELSSEETVIIPTVRKSTSTFAETPPSSSKTSFSLDLFGNSSTDKSDSEISLSNSIKAAFNEPYNKSQTEEPVKKSPAKKLKSDKKVEFKSQSKHASKPAETPTDRTKPVTYLKKSSMPFDLQNSTSVCTANNCDSGVIPNTVSLPVRHIMPAVLSQPSTSSRTPRIYVNPATQTNTQFHCEKGGNSHAFKYYGSKP